MYYISNKRIIFGIIWILGAFWFWWGICGNPLHEYALIVGGQTAPGFIIDTWEDVAEDDGRIHWFHRATYVFQLPDGRKVTGESNGSGRLKEEFRDLRNPYPIQVEYMLKDPTINRIKGSGDESMLAWFLRKIVLGGILLILFASPGIILFKSGFSEIRQNRYLKMTEPLDHV